MTNLFFRNFPMNSVTRNHIPNNDDAIEGCGHKKISMDTSSSNDVFFVTFSRVSNGSKSFLKTCPKTICGLIFSFVLKCILKIARLEPCTHD